MNDEPIELAKIPGPAAVKLVVLKENGDQMLLSIITLEAGDQIQLSFSPPH